MQESDRVNHQPDAPDDADRVDRALLARCVAGDQAALRDLLERYQPRLWSYLWHGLGDERERAEDVIQEVMLAVWQHAHTFRGEARVATWIFRLAHNRAANLRRAAARRPENTTLTLTENALMAAGDGDGETTTALRLDLAAAIRALPSKQQEVIALLFVQGFTQAEAAVILEVPLGTIKSRLAQAKQYLRASLMAPEEADRA